MDSDRCRNFVLPVPRFPPVEWIKSVWNLCILVVRHTAICEPVHRCFNGKRERKKGGGRRKKRHWIFLANLFCYKERKKKDSTLYYFITVFFPPVPCAHKLCHIQAHYAILPNIGLHWFAIFVDLTVFILFVCLFVSAHKIPKQLNLNLARISQYSMNAQQLLHLLRLRWASSDASQPSTIISLLENCEIILLYRELKFLF